MQYFPRGCQKRLFFGIKQKSLSRRFGLPAACGDFRESTLSVAITETLGKLISLDEKQHCIGWRWSSDRFHLARTVRAEGIEPDAVRFGLQMFFQLGALENPACWVSHSQF